MNRLPEHASHEFPAVFDGHSEILILGSFPSVKSREAGFYYGHPQNRFWKLLAALFESEEPVTQSEKTSFLLQHHIALWDVLAECEILGSSDASIKNAVPNDLSLILDHSKIRHIFLNGKTAYRYFLKYQAPFIRVPYGVLPSTSPANAAKSFENLKTDWSILKDYIIGCPQ